MKLRNIFGNDSEQQPRDAASPGPPGADLSELRQTGERFLAAGDEAISRALSGDSERFLAANRQQGGQ